jgi:hypothetical protein
MGKGRAPCCDKSQVKRGPWSPSEDMRLITFIQRHGHDNWRALPKQAGISLSLSLSLYLHRLTIFISMHAFSRVLVWVKKSELYV